MKKITSYTTCIDCGKIVEIIMNPATGKPGGYFCPCMIDEKKPGYPKRDVKEDIKPNSASWLLTDEEPLSNKKKT